MKIAQIMFGFLLQSKFSIAGVMTFVGNIIIIINFTEDIIFTEHPISSFTDFMTLT